MPSFHTIVTGLLIHLLIGSLVWFALWCRGVIKQVQVKRCSPMASLLIASLWLIVAWPAVGYAVCRAMLVQGAKPSR
jgi:hypothetical protein